MSLVFTLKGRSSTLSTDFVPPIELDPSHQYGIALIGFYSYNTIPNIEENTYLYYSEASAEGVQEKKLQIPSGTYEISDIEKYLAKYLIAAENERDKIFYLRPNNTTLKCELFHRSISIDFTKSDVLGKLLGFSRKNLAAGVEHQSDLPVNIVPVRCIHVDCSLAQGSFYNDKICHTIYEFSVGVDPGYAIDITPQHLIYLPVSSSGTIDNITLNILDQDFNFVNFRGEEIIVRLELKKWS